MKYCSNCGKELQDDMQFCPNCGVHTSMTFEVQSIEEAVLDEEKTSKKKRKRTIIIVLLVVLLFGVWFLYADSISANTYNQFVNLYNTMSECLSKAEKANSFIINVWGNSIYHTFDEQTDKYTRKKAEQEIFLKTSMMLWQTCMPIKSL